MGKLRAISICGLADDIALVLGLVSITSAVFLYLHELNYAGLAISIILSVIVFIFAKKHAGIGDQKIAGSASGSINSATGRRNAESFQTADFPGIKLTAGKYRLGDFCQLLRGRALLTACAAAAYLVFFALEMLVLFSARTAEAIVSPWEVVDKSFFLLFFASSLLLIAVICSGKQRALQAVPIALLILHFFTAFSVALIVYEIGYGYDPFVHQATVRLIALNGFVEPRPLYYLGQYGLFAAVHKIFQLPIESIDKLALPLASSILLPLCLLGSLRRYFKTGPAAVIPLAILLALAAGFGIFIVTTPQNLAYFFLLAMVFKCLNAKTRADFIYPALFGLAAAAIHPIAGIPALLFLAMLWLHNFYPSKTPLIILSLLMALALPALLLFTSADTPLRISPASLAELSGRLGFAVPSGQSVFLNLAYLYGFNLAWLIPALAAAGILIHKKSGSGGNLKINLLAAACLCLSYSITLLLPFDYLIEYEKDNFAERLLVLAAIFALPFIVIAWHALLKSALKQEFFFKLALFVFFSALLTASLYCSYPRKDNFFNSRGYSTGRSDLEAVRWIAADARGDFIVLANQQVSAAALKEYAFKKYYPRKGLPADGSRASKYTGEIFYYPVPTGGPLYQSYLSMVYEKPSRAAMLKAMDLVGVSEGYFVLNKYWWAFPKILDEAMLEADSWQKFGKGDVYVFKY